MGSTHIAFIASAGIGAARTMIAKIMMSKRFIRLFDYHNLLRVRQRRCRQAEHSRTTPGSDGQSSSAPLSVYGGDGALPVTQYGGNSCALSVVRSATSPIMPMGKHQCLIEYPTQY